ncbi:MAG TPA: NAD+ synthase, partial [Candidatus Omnitrophota bacterium]|nr:NAD+ synthase [Candidatus Omnitrophota bacterium]
QVNAGVGLVINISASPYHAGKMNERAKLIKDVAVKNRVFVCYVNTVGGQDDLVFDGASFIMSPDGKIISAGKEFEEDLIFADIPLNAISRETGSNKKKDLRTINLPLSPKNKVAKITPRPIKKLDRTAEIYAALVTGTRDYFAKNGFKHAVLGLSGGIDSALVAAIAVDAIGKDNVAGVSMPSKYSSGETMSDAEKLANNLGIKYINVPIKDIHKSYMALLDHILEGGTRGVTEENIQARIRGNILMAFSNKYGWLVLTTGNKSETAVGYCTLYGDMAGGFAVIKDVPKTLVYELADHVNSKAGKNIIPESIIERAPTAELKPGQKDSDSLPEYDLLDPVLKDYIEEDMSFESLRRKYPKAGFIEKVMKMVDKNEYKRRQAAPGIRITSRAFGRDRRLPITNKYDDTSKLDLDDSRG